jgi:hypothetical protein
MALFIPREASIYNRDINSPYHIQQTSIADEKISSQSSSTIPYTTDINSPASMRNLFQLGGAMKLPAEQ